MKDRVMSRREWLLVIAIIMMAEYWLISISYNFVNSQDVINFISFAATIASLLLAMLAIFYGFVQSDSSSKTNAILREQADGLKSSTLELSGSVRTIDEHLSKVSVITDRLDLLDVNIKSSIEKISGLENVVGGIHTGYKEIALIMAAKGDAGSESQRGIPGSIVYSFEGVARLVFRMTSFDGDILGCVLLKYINSGEILTLQQVHDKYFSVLAESESARMINFGTFINLAAILKVIGGLVNENYMSPLYVDDSLKALLPKFDEETRASGHQAIEKRLKLLDAI